MPIVNKILIGIVVLGCFSCQQPACDIKGELAMPACHEGTVYLQVMDDQTMQPRIVDSTVLQNGKFHFAYDGATPKTGIMAVSENGETLWGTQFIIEPGDIFLQADQQGHTHIGGTSNNDLLQKHLERWNQPLEKMQAVNAELTRLQEEGKLTNTLFDSLDRINQGYMREMRLLALAFAEQHINTPAGHAVLPEIFGLPERLLVNVAEKADSVTLRLPLMRQLVERVNVYKAVEIGKPFQDFTALKLDGSQGKLSDYAGKGKYVLLDFWASWCKPCCEEMPRLKRLYKKYKPDLEIVGVSIESDSKAWRNKIADLKMDWVQLQDTTEEAADTYVVGAIPYTVLIDPSGKIIAKNLQGEELENTIVEHLK